jgi:dihydroxyacetone kinase-like protein
MSVDLAGLFDAMLEAIESHQAELDRLDAVAGDGDHGATMVMGCRAVKAAVAASADGAPALMLRTAASAFASVGGSTGPLWGTALLRAARSLDTHGDGPQAVLPAIEAAASGMAERGRGSEGDKTVLDVVGPSSRELGRRLSEGEGLPEALRATAVYAERAAQATAQMTPRRGRASRLPDRSVGHVDPGAASAALIWRVGADWVTAVVDAGPA